MKFSFFGILAVFCQIVANAQSYNLQWQKCYGGSNSDLGRIVRQTTDGGFIVTGRTTSTDGDVGMNHGGADIWVLKLDSIGMLEWQKVYGGSDNDRSFAIEQTHDGGYIVAGHTLSNDGDVSGNHGFYDAWVFKLSSSGVIEWQKCLGGSGWEEAWDIETTSDGGYVVAGRANSTDGDVSINHGSQDYWIVKLNSTGDIEWERTRGGSDVDYATVIKPTSDGGYIVAGQSSSIDGEVSANKGESDYWVTKLNFEGKLEWEKSYGGTGIETPWDILQTREGGYIISGNSYSSDGDITGHHGGYDWWIVKVNESGNIIWQKALGGSNEDTTPRISMLEDGGFAVGGSTQSSNGDVIGNDGGADIWVVRLSEEGELLWQKSYGGTQAESAVSIQETKDKGLVLGGDAWSNDGDVSGVQGKSDYWVVKLSPETSPTQTPQTQTLVLEPNPAGADVRLLIPEDIPTLLVHISDVSGRLIHTINHPNGANLDVSGLPTGFYLISARAPDGRLFVGRLGKE